MYGTVFTKKVQIVIDSEVYRGGKMSDAKKIYSKEELLRCLFKHGNIPVILFAKDEEANAVFSINSREIHKWQNAISCYDHSKISMGSNREKQTQRLFCVSIKTGNIHCDQKCLLGWWIL